MIPLRRAKETLFGMQYVLTDGMKKNGANPMRSLMILFIIDFLQVFRVMLSPLYGWNVQTYDLAKHADMVFNVITLLSFVIGRYTFFGVGFLLVGFALGNAFYCAHLFKGGEINKIGPIKTLRFMVAVVVTTLFSSVMKWLLIPLECLIDGGGNFSTLFHGKDAPCTPLIFPEVLATAPTMVIIVLYVAFAITVAFFSLGTNPLSCAPHVQFTGRVEALFIVSKVFGTFLPFLSTAITPVAISTILCALCFAVLRKHLTILPFHHLPTNMLRGGIYGSIFWLSLSSVVVASVDALDVLSADTMQTMQWLLVGFTLPMFSLGVLLVWRRRNAIDFSIDRLRGEFEVQESMQRAGFRRKKGGRDALSPRSTDKKALSDAEDEDCDHSPESTTRSGSTPSFDPEAKVEKVTAKPKGAFEQFFNPAWERKRAFITPQDALSAVRSLLMTRSETELPFLHYMLSRALEEHPDSNEIQSPAIDHEYVLYAIKRKAAQDHAAASIGNGHFNAINLMEFDSGMQQAKTAHMQCIAELRKFWSGASSKRKTKEKEGLQQLVDRLVHFNRSVALADMEYRKLMDKYPQSSQLMVTYCSFCDTVLNDPTLANDLRKKADAIQNDDASEEGRDRAKLDDPGLQAALENRSLRSGTSMTDDDDNRIKIQKSFSSWSAEIFGAETKSLNWVTWRLKLCFLILLIVSAGGFGTMQFFLFRGYAKRDSELVERTGFLRTLVVNSVFQIRTQFIAAWEGNHELWKSMSDKTTFDAKRFQVQHWDNYELARTKRVNDFYSDKVNFGIDAMAPFKAGWKVQRNTYWDFGNDLARRMDRASKATMAQLTSTDYNVLTDLPDPKYNIVYLNENVLRVSLPTLDSAVQMYEEETKNLWALTQTIVYANTAGSLLIVAVICALVVLRLFRTVGTLQHLHLACHLSIALPLATTRKIAKFYQEAEHNMRLLVDEDEAKRAVEDADVDGDTKNQPDGANEEGEVAASSEMGSEGRPAMKIRERLMMGAGGQGLYDFLKGKGDAGTGRQRSMSLCEATRTSSAGGLAHAAADGAAQKKVQALPLSEDNLSLWTQQALRGANSQHPHQQDANEGPAQRILERRVSLCDMPPAPGDDVEEPRGDTAEIFEMGLVSLAPPAPPEPVAAAEAAEESASAEEAGAGVAESTRPALVAPSTREEDARGKAAEEAEIQVRVEVSEDASRTRADAQAGDGLKRAQPSDAEPNRILPLDDGPTRTPSDEGPKWTPSEQHRQRRLSLVSIDEEQELGQVDEDMSETSLEDRDHLTCRRTGSNPQAAADNDFHAKARSPVQYLGGILKRAQKGSWVHQTRMIEDGSFRKNKHPTSSKESTSAKNERLPLREVPEERVSQIWECVKKHERFSARASVWLLSLAMIVGLSLLLNWFPARRMGDLVTLAPTINQSGRRRMLTRLCIHLTRELVIDDGFARMSKQEIAEALHLYLARLTEANDAVRLGGSLGIKVGADKRNARHNRIMYGDGCDWRPDPTNCTYPARPGVASKGLNQLSLSFIDAAQSVLDRYGPPPATFVPTEQFLSHPRTEEEGLYSYPRIRHNATALEKLRSDPDVLFILDNFDGDLEQGYQAITNLFNDELTTVVNNAMDDNRAIFIVFMLVIFGGIYFFLFNKAVKEALHEGARARTFVARVPAHTLSPLEIETLTYMFQGAKRDDEEEHIS